MRDTSSLLRRSSLLQQAYPHQTNLRSRVFRAPSRNLRSVVDPAHRVTKPGPKPKPLNKKYLDEDGKIKWLPARKKLIQTRTREEKLRILQFWAYKLVPNEKHPGRMRHVTREETSKHYLVPESTLSLWRKKTDVIIATPRGGRSYRPAGVVSYPEMEHLLFEAFAAERDKRHPIRRWWFRLKSKLLFRYVYGNDPDGPQFKFSAGWFMHFLNRWGISLRISTHIASKIPADYRDIILEWMRFNRRNSMPRADREEVLRAVGRFDLRRIANMDQTPLPFEYVSGRTYAMKGDNTVWTKSCKSGWDKRQATLMLTVFADGISYLRPIIIFQGTADEKKQERFYGEKRKSYDPRVEVWFNPKGYCNTETIARWLDAHLLPCMQEEGPWSKEFPPPPPPESTPRNYAHAPQFTIGPGDNRRLFTTPAPENGPRLPQSFPKPAPLPRDRRLLGTQKLKPSLLALDAAAFHRVSEITTKLRENNCVPSCIPGGCTGFIQVLDVAVNKAFKGYLRQCLDELLMDLGEESLSVLDELTDSAKGTRRIIMTKAVGEALERFSREKKSVVVRCFQSLGMSLPVDGSCDNLLNVKDMENIVIGDWRREEEIDLVGDLEREIGLEDDGRVDIEYAERE